MITDHPRAATAGSRAAIMPATRELKMRWIAKESQCTDGRVWIAVDTHHSWEYAGPFVDGTEAHAFARPMNKANWIELLNKARMRCRGISSTTALEARLTIAAGAGLARFI
jgi:hypothetical protein